MVPLVAGHGRRQFGAGSEVKAKFKAGFSAGVCELRLR